MYRVMLEAFVRSIMEKMGVSEPEVHRLIIKTDKYRADYYKYYTGGHEWTNPINYDLTLNSDRIGRDECVNLLNWYCKEKGSIIFFVGLTLPRYRFSKPYASLDMNLRQCVG